ncbi:MAG: hypothetical protein IH846_06315 [Acidobacteria bacterium]|nr:hypothetical protein [Acidobacteriota bacterium]
MRKRFRSAAFWVVAVFAFSSVVLAQAAQQPGAADAKLVPRAPDGKPDLSGTWTGGARPTGGRLAPQHSDPGTLELTEWGEGKFKWNRGPEIGDAEDVYRGQHVRTEYDPVYHCYPLGLVRLGPPLYIIRGGSGATGVTMAIIQTPGKVLIIHQYRNSVRHIYTDGREHPKALENTWNGHSIGRWDGDTLVVDTVGLRDESWLDTGGHEHSTQLHVVERFRRVSYDTLEIERTLTDPIALAKPFTATASLMLSPDVDLNENGQQYDCTQFMVRKPFFGEGENTLLGIHEPTTGAY